MALRRSRSGLVVTLFVIVAALVAGISAIQLTAVHNLRADALAELAAHQQLRVTLNHEAASTSTISVVALIVSLALLLALCVYILRSILRPIRRVTGALESRRQGDLGVRVPERGHGEVGQLGRSFNAMAETLERRTNELSEANRKLARAVTVAKEASDMKSDFLANMSHEIRTPLNGVVGMVTLLAGSPLSAEQREYVDMARGSSDLLINVVSDILDVSKIEAGRLEIEPRDFDLQELIGASRAMVSQNAAVKGLELSVTVDHDVPTVVRGDRLRVIQVLGNLLSNAVKFTAEGSVSLHVAVAGLRPDATLVRFTVRDTGIGIAAERMTRLFDPFTQGDLSTTRRYGGTGLGLTICRDLTRLMGGMITGRSERGKGSAFEVTLPLAPPLGEPPARSPAVALHGLRVLVVDDDAPNRRILEAYVATWGMRSTSARSGIQALTQLVRAAGQGEPFDLALLDFEMAGGDGVELARRIAGAPRMRGTRLVLLSSVPSALSDLDLTGIGQQLLKPISQASLFEAISASLQSALPGHSQEPGDEQAEVSELAARDELPPSAKIASARILIAEDNAVNRLYVERLLARLGHEVTSAVDGRRVLDLYEASTYDLILMDCQMPGLDGYETTRELRRRETASGRRRTSILALTAAATAEVRAGCIGAGMDDFLTKPLSVADLERALALWLPATEVRSRQQPSDGGDSEQPGRDGLAAHQPAHGALDPDRLADLRGLFPGPEAAAVLAQLADNVSSELAQLDEFVVRGNRPAIAGTAHSIRGGAQMVGADGLERASGEVETLARTAEATSEAISAAMVVLHQAWEQTAAALRAQVPGDERGYDGSETG